MSMGWSLVYRNTYCLLILITNSQTGSLIISAITSSFYLFLIIGIFLHSWSCHVQIRQFYFVLSYMPFISFPFLIALVGTSSTTLKSVGRVVILTFYPVSAFILLSLNIMLVVGFGKYSLSIWGSSQLLIFWEFLW